MIGFLRRQILGDKPKVSRAEVLNARPVRNPAVTWERAARYEAQPPVALLHIPRRADRWGNFVARVFRLPDHRKLELDEIGSDVWEMCDGSLTVDALTRAICAKYHLNRRQGEASVTAYMRMLAERRLLALKSGQRKPGAGPKSGGAAAPPERSAGGRTKHEREGSAASRR